MCKSKTLCNTYPLKQLSGSWVPFFFPMTLFLTEIWKSLKWTFLPTSHLGTDYLFSRAATKSKVQTMAKVHGEEMTVKNLSFIILLSKLIFSSISIMFLLYLKSLPKNSWVDSRICNANALVRFKSRVQQLTTMLALITWTQMKTIKTSNGER